MDLVYSMIYQRYREEMLSGVDDGVERMNAFVNLMSWPEDVHARAVGESDRMARETAANLGNDVDDMVATAWQARQEGLAELARREQEAATT